MTIVGKLINRFRRTKMKTKPNPDEPLYGDLKPDDISLNRCPRCKGPMIIVNERTHRLACADSMC